MWLDGRVEGSRYLCVGLIFLFVFFEIWSEGARGVIAAHVYVVGGAGA